MPERSEIIKKEKARRGKFSDGIPRVCIRFDDGDRAQLSDITQYLEAGLPVSLAINFAVMLNAPTFNSSAGTAQRHKMTARDIHNLHVTAARHGTTLNIVTHGNDDFTDAIAQTANAYQYAFNEFNPIIQDARSPRQVGWAGHTQQDPATGNWIYDFNTLHSEGKIRSFVVPGTVEDWLRSRTSLMRKAMQDVGLQFGGRIGTAMSGGAGLGGRTAVEGQAYGFNSAGVVSQMMDPDHAGTPTYSDGMRPGMIADPYVIPPAAITDLGQTVMARSGFEGDRSDGYTNTDHINWQLGDNNAGADLGDPDLDWDLTFKYKYCRNLSMGMSWTHTSHGDTRTNGGTDRYGHVYTGLNVPFDAGAATSLNHYSSRHAAWVYRKLEQANLIRVVSVDEWNQWMYSDPEIGLDYIPNNAYIMSDVEIGDTTQGQSTTPAFVSARCLGATSWSGMNSFWDNVPADTGNQKWDSGTFQLSDCYLRDQAADFERDDAARKGGAFTGGDGVYSHPGWVKIRPNSSDPTVATWDKHIYSWIGLIPGRYKFSVLMNQPASGGLSFDDVIAVAFRSKNDVITHITDPESNDGFKEYSAGLINPKAFNLNPSSSTQTDLSFNINLSPDPTPTTTAFLDVSPGLIAAGGTFTQALDDPIVAAQPNSTVKLSADVLNWDDDLYRISLQNTDVNTAELTIHNDDSSDYTPSGAGNYFAAVEKTAYTQAADRGSPDVPWSWAVTMRFNRTGLTEVEFSRPSFEYLGPVT